MKRAVALLSLLVFAAAPTFAEDSVSLWGNYYKERSTRVVSPMVTLRKDLPYDAEVEVTYLVDQITSASGAFTVEDEPFSEYRQEVRFGARKRFLDLVSPGLNVRYSHEGDYTSFTYGLDLGFDLFEEQTTLAASFQRQHDDIRQRRRTGFRDELTTTLIALSWTQVLRRDLIGVLVLESQILRGYAENPYRVEQHPRERNRFAVGAWIGYRYAETHTTGRIDYRFYTDSWDLDAHSVNVELTQRIVPSLEIAPRFRIHTQDDVFFTELTDEQFITTDPKLRAFGSRLYGLKLVWTLSVLGQSPLELFQTARLEPAYFFLDQGTRYGPAHIAQLGVYWPF